MHKKHRIQSLHFSDPFIIDFFSSSSRQNIIDCIQLQSLMLDQIEPSHLDNLLIHLSSLSYFSSLTIPIYLNSDLTTLWNRIMQLPVLKYLKITFINKGYFALKPSDISNTTSSIEHLVIHGQLDYFLTCSLLSYLPQLRRLSINDLYSYYKHGTSTLTSFMKYLTYVSLHLTDVPFEQLENLIKTYFHQVKILRITSSIYRSYIDVGQWQKLIENHMPHLQIFDIQYNCGLNDRFEQTICYQPLLNHFNSLFWTERKWFFTCNNNYGSSSLETSQSIQSYRRKTYTLVDESNSLTGNTYHKKISFSSVEHVIVHDERIIEYCSKYFPNALELTISDQRIDRSRRSTNFNIDQIIPLNHLTKLTIDYYHRPFSKVIDLLSSTPNVQTLVLQRITIVATDYFSVQQAKQFQMVANQNIIKDLTVSFNYSVRSIQLFVNLCPKLQRISFGISENCLEPTIQFLLTQTTKIDCRLSSLTIFGTDSIINEKLKALIESEKLLLDYTIKTIHQNFYLWW
ncbi:hypothetical protein I4U23_001372 [Adineta vaga]|nr:hypothetical protein I4U23_001372 [Adineta vaga]